MQHNKENMNDTHDYINIYMHNNHEPNYNQLSNEIDNNYSIWPNDFKFIPFEYFNSSCIKISYILEYCFQKNYINKEDPKFQKYVIDAISDLNSGKQFNIDIGKLGIQSIEIFKVFHYIYKNILTKDTIKNYIDNKNETLFHKILNKNNINILNIIYLYDIIQDFLIIFDNANFNYSSPINKSLLITALSIRNKFFIIELLNRSKFNLNDDDIFQIIANIILTRITPLKYESITNPNPLYKIAYSSPNILNSLFMKKFTNINDKYLMNSKSEINQQIIVTLTYFFGSNDYSLCDNNLKRSKLVRPLIILENYYNIFKILINYGLDLTKKIYGLTLYEIYLDGCYPIQLLQPEMHQMFVKLFNSKKNVRFNI